MDSDKAMVIFQPSGRRGEVPKGINLIEASRLLGVDIEALCGEKKVCGKCTVRIEEGHFEKYGVTSSMKNVSAWQEEEEKFISPERREKGFRLGCVAQVKGDLLVFVPEESRAGKQVVSKAARDIHIQHDPAVRLYYVEVDPPSFEEPLGDFERICRALERDYGLSSLTIDIFTLRTLPNALRDGNWKVTVSVWQDKEVIRMQPGYVEESYGAAVDIGSTTIALYLCNLETGEILAAESEMNPQIIYGEDVMSRIQYTISEPDGLEKQHQAVIGTLNQLLKQAVKTANKQRASTSKEIATAATPPRNDISIEDILEIVFVGNTTMHHLLLNLPPAHLGRAPYVPTIHKAVDMKARELGLQINPSGNVHVLPTIASFIGADTSGVLIAEEPHKQDENWLIIDVGTNAELVLGNRHGLVCTSTPTGPAVEGAHIEFGMRAAPGAIERVEIDEKTLEPRYKIVGEDEWGSGKAKGICGSGIIDVVSEMFRAQILDGRGRFRRGLSSTRVREGENGPEYVVAWAEETSIGRDIHISIKDIRQIQLAKGALYVAARTLLKHAGLERPDKLILAGGFGSYIDKTKAMVIGLIPDLPLEDVYTVGNAAGDGARIALLNMEKRREAGEVARTVRRYELPTDPEFQNQFMLAMSFPHMTDPFPHIAHLIPHRELDPLAKKLMGIDLTAKGAKRAKN